MFLLLAGCYRVPDRIDPRINEQVQDLHFSSLASAFSPLTPEEKRSDWGKEYLIGRSFAEEFDLYRAVSTFKRASFLMEPADARLPEIQYDVLLCYFLAKRYDEAIEAFDRSPLAHMDQSFPSYHDLLLVLYECYRELRVKEKESRIFELMEQSFPDTAEKIRLSKAIRNADLGELETFSQNFSEPSYLDSLLYHYKSEKKSVAKAQWFNALLPGAGYLYIGQKKSAVTAFLLNGLFVAAAVQFFRHHHLAAGLITAGFETGWYFGGIYGAGEEAKYYNEKLYEENASTVLNERRLFPTLMMRHEF